MSMARAIAVKFENLGTALSKYRSNSSTEQHKNIFSDLAGNLSLVAHFLAMGKNQNSFSSIIENINKNVTALENHEKDGKLTDLLNTLQTILNEFNNLKSDTITSVADLDALIDQCNKDALQFSQLHPITSNMNLGFIQPSGSSYVITEKLAVKDSLSPKIK